MRSVLSVLALFLPMICNAQERIVRVVTTYTYADGRRVVIEESGGPPAKAVAASGCVLCGPACDCKSCQCDANSWVASCAAAPQIVATAPPPPPVVVPQYPVYSWPAYSYPTAGYTPMPSRAPLFSAGVQFRGPFGGGFSSSACVGGR